MRQYFSHLIVDAFGGQHQIVNQQEQQKEVNTGALSHMDAEKTPFGNGEEPKNTANELEPGREDKVPKDAEKAA